MAIAPGIFRQYDIRGVVDRDLTTDAAHALGGAYAAYLAEHQVRGAIAVGPRQPAERRASARCAGRRTHRGRRRRRGHRHRADAAQLLGAQPPSCRRRNPDHRVAQSARVQRFQALRRHRLAARRRDPASVSAHATARARGAAARHRAGRTGHRSIRRRRGATNRHALAPDPRGVRLRQRGRFARRVADVRATRPGEGEPRHLLRERRDLSESPPRSDGA